MPPLAIHDNNPSNSGGVIHDILAAMQDEELTDLSLVSNDGTHIRANRFVLAARSKVLKRMLYGNFRESISSEIHLMNYTTSVLNAVVEYCCHDTIDTSLPLLLLPSSSASTTTTTSIETPIGRRSNKRIIVRADECAVRQLIALYKAADFLDLPGLQDHTSLLVRDIIVKHPWLACVVFDEADPGSDLETRALNIIQCRPYVALLPPEDNNNGQEGGGGIECLRAERLVAIMRDDDIEAGELFMFDMLKRWVDYSSVQHSDDEQQDTATSSSSATTPDRRFCRQQQLQQQEERVQQQAAAAAFRRDVALYCSLHHIRLHYVEPQDLLSKVKDSNLVPQERIVNTIKRQAITALQDRVWHLTCRGKQRCVDRVLVEGAGIRDVNGVYHRIEGLTNGDIYSKHEVSCGQQYVYTISCSHNKEGKVECRIFCSKVLTHDAVKILHKMRTLNPLFQPLLQVIKIDVPPSTDTSRKTIFPLNRHRQLYLSDGEHYIPATLGAEVNALVEKNDIVENTLIKVLEFDLYELDRCKAIHVTRVNLVSADPGHLLGSPTSISGVEVDRYVTQSEDEEDPSSSSSSLADTAAAAQREGLRQLYSCYYPMILQVRDSKIPRAGWKVDIHGKGPSPKCTWIPASAITAGAATAPGAATAAGAAGAAGAASVAGAAGTAVSGEESEERRNILTTNFGQEISSRQPSHFPVLFNHSIPPR